MTDAIRTAHALVVSGLVAVTLAGVLLLFMTAPLVLFAGAATAGLARWAWRSRSRR